MVDSIVSIASVQGSCKQTFLQACALTTPQISKGKLWPGTKETQNSKNPSMSSTTTMSPAPVILNVAHDAVTSLQYLDPATKLNRRYLSPGSAFNTGKFEWRDVVVKDARPSRSDFELEKTGFELVQHKSEVRSVPRHKARLCLLKTYIGQ